jgi:Fe-S-cluster containining protein
MPNDQASQDTVEVNFTLNVGGGQLHASVPVPSATTYMTHMVPALRVLSSNIVDAVVRQVNAEGYQISCKAGCGACCRQLVPVTLFEADAMAEWIRSLPPEQKAALEARFASTLRQLADSGILARLDPDTFPLSGTPERDQLSLDYLAQGIPCPFLEDESCSIHPIRPLICREYLVTSPPEFCANPTPETVQGVPMPVKISQALSTYCRRITGLETGWIPLVFLTSWMKQGLSLAQAPQAPGPELLETVIRQLIPDKPQDTPQA